MSTAKNCLLAFRNKKINDFGGENAIISAFENCGVWFDLITFAAYDCSEEISRAVCGAKDNYENIVLYCPREMEAALKKFVCKVFNGELDKNGELVCGDTSVFLLLAGGDSLRETENIAAEIKRKNGDDRSTAYVKTVGAPAEKISAAIIAAKEVCGGFEFTVREKFGDCTIRMSYYPSVSKTAFDEVLRAVLGVLNEYVYALENVTLAERLIQLLKLRKMKICTAESFTGGGVGKRIVEISGASEVYFEGVNTYSNEAKCARLGVRKNALTEHGAVSEEVAFQMAEGLIRSGNCDVAVATTGIAGPKSDNTNKPVGLIYIAIGLEESVAVYKYNLSGNRESITETAINLALFLAYKSIK